MAIGTFTLVTAALQEIGDGTFDLDGNSFKACLVSSSSNISESSTVYGSLTGELATANGYTSGGVALATPTFTGGVFKTGNATWTASGGSIVARWLVIYVDATVNGIVKPILGYFLMDNTPADYTIASGDTRNWACDSTNGWFKATKTP